jgi:hypothetical protein
MTLWALCCVLGLLVVPFPISREAERIILVVHSGSTHVSGISHLPPCLIDEGALTCIWFPRYYIYFVLTYREPESEACCSVTVASCACWGASCIEIALLLSIRLYIACWERICYTTMHCAGSTLGGQVFIFVIVDMFSLLLRSFWCLFTNEGNLQLPCAFLRLGVWSVQ